MSIFHRITKDLKAQRNVREVVIRETRQALQDSKLAIFAVHRSDDAGAKKLVEQAGKQLEKLQRKLTDQSRFINDGNLLAALEEFGEAWLVVEFARGKKLGFPKKPKLAPEQQIGALADFTGELSRRAVLVATERKLKDVEKIYKTVSDVVRHLAEADLTGQMRQKFDEAKRNLKRIEEIRYELSLRR
jgi:translin